MQFKRKKRVKADINITSFSDIAFLLIIFFILTTTFQRPAGSKLTIPSGASDSSKKEDKQLTVNVKPGEIRYGEKSKSMNLEELRLALINENLLALTPEKRIVILDSAPDVSYEEYFQVATAIAKAGGVLALIDQEEEASAK